MSFAASRGDGQWNASASHCEKRTEDETGGLSDETVGGAGCDYSVHLATLDTASVVSDVADELVYREGLSSDG